MRMNQDAVLSTLAVLKQGVEQGTTTEAKLTVSKLGKFGDGEQAWEVVGEFDYHGNRIVFGRSTGTMRVAKSA